MVGHDALNVGTVVRIHLSEIYSKLAYVFNNYSIGNFNLGDA